MKKLNKHTGLFIWSIATVLFILMGGFQNCAPGFKAMQTENSSSVQNSPSPSPSPAPAPAPAPAPSPGPSPNPIPNPVPNPLPNPGPTPDATPNPTPTPTPTPAACIGGAPSNLTVPEVNPLPNFRSQLVTLLTGSSQLISISVNTACLNANDYKGMTVTCPASSACTDTSANSSLSITVLCATSASANTCVFTEGETYDLANPIVRSAVSISYSHTSNQCDLSTNTSYSFPFYPDVPSGTVKVTKYKFAKLGEEFEVQLTNVAMKKLTGPGTVTNITLSGTFGGTIVAPNKCM